MANNIVFLSHPLTTTTPSYGDRDRLEIIPNASIKAGASANTSKWVFTNNHMGTHIDMPYHFDEDGKKTLDYSAQEWVFNKVVVVNIPCENAKLIDADDFVDKEIDSDIDLLLINTHYEQHRESAKYHNDNPGLAASLADYLRNRFPNLRCVGYDSISVTSWKYRPEGRLGHRAFLGPNDANRSIWAIEDVSFIALENRELDWVIVSPLRVEDGNGGPVTIIAKVK